MKNLNPVFNETFEFDFSKMLSSAQSDTEEDEENDFSNDPMDCLLMVKVMDYDRLTKDDSKLINYACKLEKPLYQPSDLYFFKYLA